jgi:hypothetical protein
VTHSPEDGTGPDLTAMVTRLAEGHPAGDLERAILRLKLITEAQAKGASWNAIAAALNYPSGKQLKKDTARLHEHVTRQLRLAQNRERRDGPYVHEHAAPEPGSRYVPYTMTGPGVMPSED